MDNVMINECIGGKDLAGETNVLGEKTTTQQHFVHYKFHII
jgi:hypothetical protein